MVVLFQIHPQDKDIAFSVVKVWDEGLTKNLAKEFEVLWKKGENLELKSTIEK